MSEKLVIGIDGGGTKTVAWLARISDTEQVEILGRGLAGTSNVRAVGWESAVQNLARSLDDAWSDSRQEPRAADAAVFALAGSGQDDVKSRFQHWAQQQSVAKQVQVVHDALAVIAAGTPEGWGVALVAGTGAVAFAMDPSGNSNISGGWGYWFGDEGSAFWLGQAALRAVTLDVDERGPQTDLTQAILDRLETNEPREILGTLSAATDERQAIASLADLVIQFAEQDKVADEIVHQACTHLATLVTSAAKKLALGDQFPVALAGGVLCGSSLVRDRLIQKLLETGFAPSSSEIVREPVNGCIELACQAIRSS